MGESVAGKIRVDLLANTAQFKAGMREAGDSLGGFEQQVEKFDRKFNSKKAVEARASAEHAYWVEAMKGAGGPLAGSQGLLDQLSPDRALRNQTRWKSMTPWGNTVWSQLSTDQANYAAEAGQSSAKSFARSFGQHMTRDALKESGVPFAKQFGGLLGSVSGGTLALGAGAAVLIKSYNAAAQLGRELRGVREEAVKAGVSYEAFLKQRGEKPLSKFVRGGAEAAATSQEAIGSYLSFKAIGARVYGFSQDTSAKVLNALTGNREEFQGSQTEKLAEEMDRADAAARKTQRLLAEKERIDAAVKSIAGKKSELTALTSSPENAERERFVETFKPNAGLLAQWDTLAAKIKVAKAALEVKDFAQSNFDQWREAADPNSVAKGKYRDAATTAGMTRDEIAANLRLFDQRRKEAESLTRANALATSLPGETAAGKYRQASQDAELWHKFHNGRVEDERTYQAMKMKALRDYYREAAGLDAKQLVEQSKSATQKYQERVDAMRMMGGAGLLPQDTYNRLKDQSAADLRRQLGVARPLDDFRKSWKELEEARKAGLITEQEFSRRERALRRTAVQESTSDLNTVSPIGAAARGSQDAYSLIVQQQLADPKIELAKQTNAKLDAVIKHLSTIAAKATGPAGDELAELFDFGGK